METLSPTDTTKPQFAVIITTYKRPKLLKRALESVFTQTYLDWRIILVNDSPETDYPEIDTLLAPYQGRIQCIANTTNQGKNASVNTALALLSRESFDGLIVFLDDDDWLDTKCLETFHSAVTKNTTSSWFVSNRVVPGTTLTINRTGKNHIRYLQDCLLTKRFKGDATHCINFQKTQSCTFPKYIKNAEEWIYFADVAQHISSFIYLDIPGTHSDGYLPDGLTKISLSRTEKLQRLKHIRQEITERALWNIPITLYIVLRTIKNLVGR